MTRAVKDPDMNDLAVTFTQAGTTLSFTAGNETATGFILPLTYYKGYQVYKLEGSSEIQVDTYESSNGLVACSNEGSGSYICRYVDTPLRKASLSTSLAAVVVLGIHQCLRKRKEDSAS